MGHGDSADRYALAVKTQKNIPLLLREYCSRCNYCTEEVQLSFSQSKFD